MLNFKAILKPKPASPHHFLGIDLGSDVVKAVVFEFFQGGVRVLGIGRRSHKPGAMRGGIVEDLSAVEEAVDLAIKEAGLTCQIFPKEAVFGLSGNGVFGSTTTVRVNRKDAASKFSEKELLAIAKKVEDNAFIEASQKMAEQVGNSELEIDLVNSAICSTKIDGNFVEDPVGMVGEQIEVGIFTAYSPLSQATAISDLAKDLDLEVLTISSGLYALVKAMTSSEPNINAVILDIGGHTTDIAVVFGGGIVASRSLGLGSYHLTQALVQGLGLAFDQAEKRKILYSEGTLDQAEKDGVASLMRPVLDLWVSGLELAFGDFEGIKAFPAKFILTGGGASLKEFSDIVADYPWGKMIPLSGYLDLEVLSSLNFAGIADASGKFSGSGDIIPASLGAVGMELLGS